MLMADAEEFEGSNPTLRIQLFPEQKL